MHSINLLTLAALSCALTTNAAQVRMEVVANTSEVVLGQPLMVSLNIANESTKAITVYCCDRKETLITVESLDGSVVRPHHKTATLDTTTFGQRINPDTNETLVVAVTELADAPTTGEYPIKVSIPALGLSGSLPISAKPYQKQVLEAWMEHTTNLIVSRPLADDRFELLTALSSIRGELSEPYVCRVLTDAEWVAIPAAVDKLEARGTPEAATCLIGALSHYKGIEREYVKSSLGRLRTATSSPELRERIEEALGDQGNR